MSRKRVKMVRAKKKVYLELESLSRLRIISMKT